MHGYKIGNQNHIHFITPTVVGWVDVFSRKIYRDIIVDSLIFCQKEKGLDIHAYVIMSNHIHLVVSAREGYVLSDVIRDFKRYTSKEIIKAITETPEESRSEWMLKLFKYYAKYNKNNSTYQFWKRDNHPVELISDEWIGRKIDYIHNNPVTAGIVMNAKDYIYSSAGSYYGGEILIEIQKLELW